MEGEIDPGEKDWIEEKEKTNLRETFFEVEKKNNKDDGIWRRFDAVDCDMVWRTGTI